MFDPIALVFGDAVFGCKRGNFGEWLYNLQLAIPKGEYLASEDPLEAAKREFFEETGFQVGGTFRELTTIRQPSGKKVCAWAVRGEVDAGALTSTTFAVEWPPKSGKQMEFPEVDRAGWFDVELARRKILPGQLGFIDQLCKMLRYPSQGNAPESGKSPAAR